MDIGIDLGTTYSVIALNGNVRLAEDYPEGIYLKECDVTIVPTPDGEQTFPSALWEDADDPGRYIVGADALRRADEGDAPVLFSKRRMGTSEPLPLHGRHLTARQAAAAILAYLKACAEQALGQPVRRAVITHPAYFDRIQVEETRQAAIDAGFDMALPEQMLMEPIAAALAYTRSDQRDPLRVLTYDLGGGTFDVTYLERREGVISVRAFDGDHLLGGYNFDRDLTQWILEKLEAKGRSVVFDESDTESRGRLAQLLRLAEAVKIKLAKSADDSRPVEVRSNLLLDQEGRRIGLLERISRQEFVALIQPHLDKTIQCCRRALEKSGVEADELHEILMVGGSTYGPWIGNALRQAFPGVEPKLFSPDLCVAAGAAIQAAMVLPLSVESQNLRLTLEVPTATVLDAIDIGGQVSVPADMAGPVNVSLMLPTGRRLGAEPLDENGRFLFADVALAEMGANHFQLLMQNRQGDTLLDHPFTIRFAPEETDVTTVTTVLPKPLYLETFDGLVPLAEEGATLPARRNQTLIRDNDNRSIAIRIFQQGEVIGAIRVEDIPPEGGRGSRVDIAVTVTEKNQIEGTATITSPTGRVVKQSAVSVAFAMSDIPPLAVLEAESLELDWEMETSQANPEDGDHAESLSSEATPLRERLRRLLAQQPVDRLEVYAVLRSLRRALTPPPDGMQPTRREFAAEVADCRQAIDAKAAQAQAVLDADASALTRSDHSPDASALAKAKAALKTAQTLADTLARAEAEGLAAHAQKNQRGWGKANEALAGIQAKLSSMPSIELPVFIVKMFALMQIQSEMSRLQETQGRMAQEGRLSDWQAEIERIGTALTNLMESATAVDDDLPQARSQLGILVLQRLEPLKRDIGRIGIDTHKL